MEDVKALSASGSLMLYAIEFNLAKERAKTG